LWASSDWQCDAIRVPLPVVFDGAGVNLSVEGDVARLTRRLSAPNDDVRVSDKPMATSKRIFAAPILKNPPDFFRVTTLVLLHRSKAAQANNDKVSRPLSAQACVVIACSALGAREGHNDAMRSWSSGMLEHRGTVSSRFALSLSRDCWSSSRLFSTRAPWNHGVCCRTPHLRVTRRFLCVESRR
jgi:hypothetical protein